MMLTIGRESAFSNNQNKLQAEKLWAARYGFSVASSNLQYLIRPTGLGGLISFRSKFQVIAGDIWLTVLSQVGSGSKSAQVRLHPLFEYVLQKNMRYFLINHKDIHFSEMILSQISRPQDQEKGQFLVRFVQQMARKIRREREEKRAEYYGFGRKKMGKLKQYQLRIQALGKVKEEEYLLLIKNKRAGLYSPHSRLDNFSEAQLMQIAAAICSNVKKLSPLIIQDQLLKVSLFKDAHISLFSTNQHSNILHLPQPLSEFQARFHSVQEHLFLKNRMAHDKSISIQLIRDIALLLNDYSNAISQENNRCFYEYVHPSNIVIDQFALKPKLKFQPVIQEALGLKNKPLSIQNIITLFPTPNGFNYFQSPRQVNQSTVLQVKLSLEDSFYGCIGMFKFDCLDVSQKQEIQRQRWSLAQLKEHMFCWRFLLVCYYILHARQFGKDKRLSNSEQIKRHFVGQLKQAQQKLARKGYLQTFLGHKGRQEESEDTFHLTFQGILCYLELLPDDNLVQSYKYQRLISYQKTRSFFLRSIMRILLNPQLLVKVFNIKKYICMFFLLAVELLQEQRLFFDCQFSKKGERKKIKIILDKVPSCLSNGKSYRQFLEYVYRQICSYLNRNPGQDRQAHYITEQPQGKAHFQQVKSIYVLLEEVAKISQQLDADEQEKESIEIGGVRKKSKIGNSKRSQLGELLRQRFGEVKSRCYDLVLAQLRSPFKMNYKSSKGSDLSIKKSVLLDLKLQMLVRCLFSLGIGNFHTYESLIIPLLSVDNHEKIANKELLQKQLTKLRNIEELLANESSLGKDTFDCFAVFENQKVGLANNVSFV